MLRNYFKVAIRTLIRHKTFSAINIFGLAIGMACTIMILMWLFDELGYDRFLPNTENIYRVNTQIKFGSLDSDLPLTSDMFGPTVKQDYPQIKEYTRIYTFGTSKQVKRGDVYLDENRSVYADSTFFRVFNFPTVAGNTYSALNSPNTVVISEKIAKKYFGRSNAVGGNIEISDNNGTYFKVTAVIKDMPNNSHFNFDLIFPMKNLDYPYGNYISSNFYTYLLLQDRTDYKEFEKNLEGYILRHAWPYAQKIVKLGSLEEFKKSGNKIGQTLTPISKIHLYSNRRFELSPNGSIQYLYIFSIIALFILLIASVNFMNLTTARSAGRAREIGIRKVLGTDRRNLILQFLTESVLLSYISIFAAIAFVYLLLPLFNTISGKKLSMINLITPVYLLIITILPLAVGIIAGSYPALFLSGFKPVKILKGRLLSGNKGINIRGALVVFQFASSVILIIATLIIYRQLKYVQNKNLGYNNEQVLVINNTYSLKENAVVFKNEMLNVPGVKEATVTGFLPVPSERNGNTFFKDASFDMKGGVNFQRWEIDYDYIDFMRMKILEGRNFSRDFGTDSSSIIINEEAARQLGYRDPVGKDLYTLTGPELKNRVHYKVIGLVRDFNYESLKQPIGPLGFLLKKNYGAVSLRVAAASIPRIINQAELKWSFFAKGNPFSYRFMDESFNDMYAAEKNVALTAMAASLLAVLVACLGLFGLSIFMAQQKTKEIGIRKTLGASVPSILFILSKEFLKWLALANLIAWPVAYYFMNKWLQDFAYRIEISWWMFAASGLIALVIALFTVSFQAVKAAVANPIESLRYE
jgi:putative ABC transport system permease protein